MKYNRQNRTENPLEVGGGGGDEAAWGELGGGGGDLGVGEGEGFLSNGRQTGGQAERQNRQTDRQIFLSVCLCDSSTAA